LNPTTAVAFTLEDIELAYARGDVAALVVMRREALDAGDRHGRRMVNSAYLLSKATFPTGVSRPGLVMGLACAHVSTLPSSFGEIHPWLLRVRDEGLALVELECGAFGARAEGKLDHPIGDASQRLEVMIEAAEELLDGVTAAPWELVRALSFAEEFHLAAAFARGLHLAGGGHYSTVAYAAHRRHHWNDSRSGVALALEVLSEGWDSAAANCAAACYGDLGEFAQGLSWAVRSLSVQPDEHSGNTARRAVRNAGYARLVPLCNAIALSAATGLVPPSFPGSAAAYRRDLAVRVACAVGYRDMAELSLSATRHGGEWARLLRAHADQVVHVPAPKLLVGRTGR